MSTIKAFNEMMGQFLEDISGSFPEEPAIQVAKTTPREGREPFDTFMKQVGPWVDPMMRKDDAFFCEENEFAKGLNLHVIWQREDCTPQCKMAIWQWLSSLYMISMSLNMFPPDTLAALESAAENIAKKMQAKQAKGQPMNEQTLMAGMNDMLTQMMRSGPNNPLAGLMGGMLPDAPKPTPRRKASKKSR